MEERETKNSLSKPKASLTETNREELARTRIACLRAAKKLRLIIDLCEDATEDRDANAIQLHEQIEQVISKVREKAQSKETRNRYKKTKASAKAVRLAS